jgi:hypothetical protein
MEKIFFERFPVAVLFGVRMWDKFDVGVVDGVVNGISASTIYISSKVRKLQFGDTQGYVSVFMAGLAILLIILWFMGG